MHQGQRKKKKRDKERKREEGSKNKKDSLVFLKQTKERMHGRKIHKETIAYSSTDNFLSPIPVFDSLIFCCAN